MKRRNLTIRLAAGVLSLAAWLGLAPHADAQTVLRTLRVGSQTRSYYLHVPPSYTGTEPVPLVFMLHGRGGNGLGIERQTRFSEKADEVGFLVVYPNAIGAPPAWSTGWNSQGGGTPQQNIDFLTLLIETLEQEFWIDPARIYVSGHSSGGMMSHLIGSVLAEKLAAIAPTAAAVGSTRAGTTYVEAPPPAAPLSVLMVHGLLDETVPYDGGGDGVLDFVPVWYSTYFWVVANNCSFKPKTWVSPDETVVIDTYRQGTNGTEVALCTILNGGHQWNSGTTLSMRDLIWDFFASHPKK